MTSIHGELDFLLLHRHHTKLSDNNYKLLSKNFLVFHIMLIYILAILTLNTYIKYVIPL